MKVDINTALQQLKDIYLKRYDDQAIADWLAEMSLDQELTSNRFSGFGEAINARHEKLESKGSPAYDIDKPALKLIDCNGTEPLILMKDLIPQGIKWAKQQGQLFIGIKNGGYHQNLDSVVRKFAEQDVIAVYSANGGPQGVVPYGGSKDIFGTNPIAYGIPTSGLPIVFDAATAQYAYGTIKLAKEQGTKLEPNTYFDKDGQYTTDPSDAESLIPFGGYKGYAINLLLEVLTGALVGGKSGTLQTNESELGGFLLLVDPAVFGNITDFKAQTDQLVRDIESNPPAEGFTEVRVPGYRAQRLRQDQLSKGQVEVAEDTYEKFLNFYKEFVN